MTSTNEYNMEGHTRHLTQKKKKNHTHMNSNNCVWMTCPLRVTKLSTTICAYHNRCPLHRWWWVYVGVCHETLFGNKQDSDPSGMTIDCVFLRFGADLNATFFISLIGRRGALYRDVLLWRPTNKIQPTSNEDIDGSVVNLWKDIDCLLFLSVQIQQHQLCNILV